MNPFPSVLGQRYAYVVAGLTFVALLVAAGQRAAPGVLMIPVQGAFGWSRATVSTAAAVGIFLYGMVGPFAAALMQTVGIKKTLIGGLVLMTLATAASLLMTQPWQYIVTWGVISGVGTGAVTNVLAASVVNRWFARNQGLMLGLLTAATATGGLIFLPVMARLSEGLQWRPVVVLVSVTCALLIPFILLLMPERPGAVGLPRLGETEVQAAPPPVGRSLGLAFSALGRAGRTPIFWLLFCTFVVCGLTTNGLVSTHMIAFCGDHGIPALQAAGLLSLMGVFDLIGTTGSGWLTDRYDPKRLLFIYYGLRGLSLMALPFLDFGPLSLTTFAVFYGLDWIATVPPTVKLATVHFGDRDGPIVVGWLLVGHQIGAAIAALGAGLVREAAGSYQPAFLLAGLTAVGAALAFILLGNRPSMNPVLAARTSA